MIVTKRIFEKSLYAAVVALALVLLTTNPLSAQVTFNLTGVGPTEANLAGVYTSPYMGTINGGPTIPVICDDFSDESYVPETWKAYVTSLPSITSEVMNNSDLKWQGSTFDPSLTQAQAYEAAAILSIEILGSTTVQAQQAYSFALWGLFDPYGNGSTTNPPDLGAFGQLEACSSTTCASALSSAMSDLSAALGDVTNSSSTINGLSVSAYLSDYNVTIYSYDAKANPAGPVCGSGPCPISPPQEFITVSMAEPPSPVLLGVDLLGLAGLILVARGRGWLAR